MEKFSKLESILNGVLIVTSIVDFVLGIYTAVKGEKNESK